MIHWMLTRLEKNPHSVFEEWELRKRDPAAFEDLQRESLIRRLPAPGLGESFIDPSGRLLTTVPNLDGTLEAIDEDDPECEPVPVTLSKVASWSVDLNALCERFREANGLGGTFGRLHERLYLLGDLSPGRVAVLAFLADDRSGVPLLQALPALAPTAAHEFLVVLPSLTLSPIEQRRLEPLHIWAWTSCSDDPFALSRVTDMVPSAQPAAPQVDTGRPAEPSGNIFRKEAEYWTIGFDGSRFRLKDIKGLRYLAHLLSNPDKELHVLELVAAVERAAETPGDSPYRQMSAVQLAEEGLRAPGSEAGDVVLDDQAIHEYKNRLEDIAEQLDEAERFNNLEAVAKLKEEQDTILAHLTGARGLSGRPRVARTNAERARVNVTNQVRLAIKKIGQNDPALARFLGRTTKTGTYCSHTPDNPISWVF